MEIEAKEYQRFLNAFKLGLFPSQRLGQAFYNHFSLHKLSDQWEIGKVWQMDGQKAREYIQSIFVIR